MQTCQVYRSGLGTLSNECTDRTNAMAAAHQQPTLVNEEARMHSQSYVQARGELASPYAQAAKQENDHRSLQQHWHGEESGLVEPIESMCQQARTYDGQVRAEAQHYTREVATETNTARTNLQRVENQASRDLVLANA